MNHQQIYQNSRHRSTTTRVEQYRDGAIHNLLSSRNRILQQKPLKERIKESLPAVIIGTLLIFCGTIVLFWNEGEAVSTARTLDEGYNSVVKVQTSDLIEPNNEGKLIHVWAALVVETPLQDPFFGILVRAVSLKRRVQVYQWIEEETSFAPNDSPDSPDSSYSYSQLWRDKLVDSSAFNNPYGHENPTSTPIVTVIQTAEVVKIGSYVLSPAIKDTFSKFVPFSGDEPPDTDEVKLHNGMYYFTKDIFNPETGDIRVQFYFAGHDGELVTSIGRQAGSSLRPYVTSSGRELLIVRQGKYSVEEMFSSEHARSRFLTWVNRLLGWFLMFIGMIAVSSIIQYLVTFSPLLRDVIFLGIGSASVTLSMSLSLVLIGGAWCFYRPGLALFILGVATLPLIRAAIGRHNRAQQSARPGVGGV